MTSDRSSGIDPHQFASGVKGRRRLAELRATWAQPLDRERDFEAIARYHARRNEPATGVDDATWTDLGMDDVFARIDRTVSLPGRQVLYRQLRSLEFDEAVLRERTRQQQVFRDDAPLRESVQLITERLGSTNAAYIPTVLLGPEPPAPEPAWLYPLLAVLPAILTIATLIHHAWIIPTLAALALNFVLTQFYTQRFKFYFGGFAQLNHLLGVAEKLGSLPNPHSLPQLAQLTTQQPLMAQLRRQIGWLVIDRSAMDDLSQALVGYVNMIFLVDILVFGRAARIFHRHRKTLLEIFEAVGSLDAAISTASYSSGAGAISVPELVTERKFAVEGLYHPLIPNAVSNSFTLEERSALIAGPNMAGKTAFIRTVGINLVLAQTLHLALATRAVLPRAVVRSAIRREDSLAEGSSYFFTEIKQLRTFAETEAPLHVFLVDEILRGTNTVERIASSAAVLRHLATRQIVFATTHDFELQDLLADAITMYHFSDCIVEDRYTFDYQLRTGPVRTRNAIKLLALSGYPPTIVHEAERLAAQLDSKR